MCLPLIKMVNYPKKIIETNPSHLRRFLRGQRPCNAGREARLRPCLANDICPRNAAMDTANHGAGHFHPGSIEEVRGAEIPQGEGSVGYGSRAFSASHRLGQRPVI